MYYILVGGFIMDVKKMINQIVDSIKDNASIREQFDKEPVKVIEKVLKIDLPDDIVNKIIDGVKAKLTLDSVSDAASSLKGLFGKK